MDQRKGKANLEIFSFKIKTHTNVLYNATKVLTIRTVLHHFLFYILLLQFGRKKSTIFHGYDYGFDKNDRKYHVYGISAVRILPVAEMARSETASCFPSFFSHASETSLPAHPLLGTT